MIKRTLMAIAVAAAMIAPAVGAQPAMAKISSVDTSCSNGGGNQPGGQQPTCSGTGLTQNSENQNPSGSAPPGQNK
jgi:Spy/CpxP family protein refolding chaperone